MHIYISQNNNSENINTTLINKLYKLIKNDDQYGILSENSNFLGALIVNSTYKEYEDYIESKYPYLIISVSKYYILFADEEVKSLLISNFSEDGFGISSVDIEILSTLNNIFQSNENIKTFNELSKLNRVKQLKNNEFKDCINLESIDLSKIESIGNYALANTKISSINSNSIMSIGDYAFQGCNYLSEINIPNCSSIGSMAFKNCQRLESLILNIYNLTSIGNWAFQWCDNLNYIDISKTKVTSLNYHAFENHVKNITFRAPKTVTYLGELYINVDGDRFYLTGLENVNSWSQYGHAIRCGTLLTPMCYKGTHNWPADIFVEAPRRAKVYTNSLFYPNIEVIGNSHGNTYGKFTHSPLSGYATQDGNLYINLLYFKKLQTMGYGMFARCIIDNLIINNVNVPAYDTTSEDIDFHIDEFDETPFGFGNNLNNTQIGTLWVPDEAVSTYQASPLFAGITIKGINTMTDGEHYDLPRFATFEDWEEAYQYNINNDLESPVGLIEEWM